MRKEKRKKGIEKALVLTLSILAVILFSSLTFAITGPSGITHISNTTGASTPAEMVNISGGYISKFNLTVTSQNERWKAFVGDVNGKFTLDDSSGSTIYDWDLATTSGQVYATRTSTAITWAGIDCAEAGEITNEDTFFENSGGDNIASTFTAASNSETFMAAGLTQITPTTCYSLNTYVNNASSSEFEEVVLATAASEIVYATILEDDETGYDGGEYDFQMIVPESANKAKGATAYYLYVELVS